MVLIIGQIYNEVFGKFAFIQDMTGHITESFELEEKSRNCPKLADANEVIG